MRSDQLRCGVFLLAIFLVLASLPACSQGAKYKRTDGVPSTGTSRDGRGDLRQPQFCSGRLSNNSLHDFLSSINAVIDVEASSPINDRQLFAESVTLVRDGKVEKLSSENLTRYSGKLPAREDWRIIASLLAAGKLFPVGWRGCILNNGKAAFIADSDGNIHLSSFDFDQEWER